MFPILKIAKSDKSLLHSDVNLYCIFFFCIYVYHGIGVEPEELDLARHRLQILILLDHGDARQAAVML